MAIDPVRYPTLTRYLAGVPDGLWSHPECLVRTEVHETVRRDFPQLAERKDLPLRITEFLTGAYRAEWMPEVLAGACSMLVRDAIYNDDETFLKWRYDEMLKLFKKPTYRVMMFLLSPSLILMSSTKKWSTFHMGSKLTAEQPQKQGFQFVSDATLDFPQGLFDETYALLVATTYQAALDCSRAKKAEVRVSGTSPTRVDFTATWDT